LLSGYDKFNVAIRIKKLEGPPPGSVSVCPYDGSCRYLKQKEQYPARLLYLSSEGQRRLRRQSLIYPGVYFLMEKVQRWHQYEFTLRVQKCF